MYDPVIKFVSDEFSRDVVGFLQRRLGLPIGGPFEHMKGNLPHAQVDVDRVFRVFEPAPMLIHAEWESGSYLGRAERFLEYNVLLKRHETVPVRTIVVLLRKEANSSDMTGRLEWKLPDGKPYLVFEYDVVRLWELPAEELLKEPGLTPFAPLSDVDEADLPSIARRMEEKWKSVDGQMAAELFFATRALMGLRFDNALIDSIFKDTGIMQESVFIQRLLKQGTVSGRVMEGRANLLRLGERRFGDAVTRSRGTVESIEDLDRLHRMFDRAIDAADWDAVLATE